MSNSLATTAQQCYLPTFSPKAKAQRRIDHSLANEAGHDLLITGESISCWQRYISYNSSGRIDASHAYLHTCLVRVPCLSSTITQSVALHSAWASSTTVSMRVSVVGLDFKAKDKDQNRERKQMVESSLHVSSDRTMYMMPASLKCRQEKSNSFIFANLQSLCASSLGSNQAKQVPCPRKSWAPPPAPTSPRPPCGQREDLLPRQARMGSASKPCGRRRAPRTRSN